ncbi:MAG TPA: histidinol-phosphate transaminase, partial [Bacillota bacterium]|nr:histidinol-phosphate transaminase [Bacillota bacterium]
THTNFIMVDVERDSIKLTGELLRRGIAVRAGAEYGMPTYLRITIGTGEENILVLEQLKDLLA